MFYQGLTPLCLGSIQIPCKMLLPSTYLDWNNVPHQIGNRYILGLMQYCSYKKPEIPDYGDNICQKLFVVKFLYSKSYRVI